MKLQPTKEQAIEVRRKLFDTASKTATVIKWLPKDHKFVIERIIDGVPIEGGEWEVPEDHRDFLYNQFRDHATHLRDMACLTEEFNNSDPAEVVRIREMAAWFAISAIQLRRGFSTY